MKKGKTININQYDSLKTFYGTVDSKELKSIYINIQTWVTPIEDKDSWSNVVNTLTRSIKHSVFSSLDRELFKENFIVDLDLRTSGIRKDKKSFMNLEINLYTNISLDFKSNEIKESVKKIIKKIYRENIINNRHFNFSSSKNSETYQTI
jgi:hypothetical protein